MRSRFEEISFFYRSDYSLENISKPVVNTLMAGLLVTVDLISFRSVVVSCFYLSLSWLKTMMTKLQMIQICTKEKSYVLHTLNYICSYYYFLY